MEHSGFCCPLGLPVLQPPKSVPAAPTHNSNAALGLPVSVLVHKLYLQLVPLLLLPLLLALLAHVREGPGTVHECPSQQNVLV